MAILELKMGDAETGEFVFYKAVEADIAAGLAVHGEVGNKGFWQISHAPTGMFIVGGLSYANAIAARDQMLLLTDWKAVKFQRFPDAAQKRLRDAVNEIISFYFVVVNSTSLASGSSISTTA